MVPVQGRGQLLGRGGGGEEIHDAVWSYEDPFTEVAGIKDYVAFYPNKVEIEADPA